MTTEIITEADHKMGRAVEAMERDFQGIRTGRASTSLVERIHVDYYGTSTPLNQLAGISVPEAHQIVIQPWDRAVLGAIEKAIIKSDIGLLPNVDGTVVRLNIPPLTEERRKDLVRVVHKRMEEAKVEIRNLRRDAADAHKKEERDGSVGTDDAHLIVIQPWDRSVLGAIEKAITKSDIGLVPNVDGTVVRLNVPPLTEERRKEIVKQVRRRAEEARVEVRNHRREVADHLKKALRDGDLSEDEERR